MRTPLALAALALIAVAAAWVWLGSPVDLDLAARREGGEIPCMSYAPFRANQSPLDDRTRVSASEIDDDLARLASLTHCVRTYSVDHGLDQVAPLAERRGLKVIQGLWLSSNREKNRFQIDTTIALAKQYPQAISAIVVGNEVLLRGELSAADLAAIVREVKAAVPVPVTYADVWEFWLRNRDLASAVDFITIHILPYWEDFPIAARDAAAHVDAIHRRVAAAFPGKDILIGEVGWPSAGRMRAGALPSLANQARVLQQVMARAEREGYRVNLIEAFDQPWKRQLEGTVGGHWGLLSADARRPKFAWNAPVSNHPYWPWQMVGGWGLVAAVFAAAALVARRSKDVAGSAWFGAGVNAVAAGILAPWAIAAAPVESLGAGGWMRGCALAGMAIAAPVVATAALVRRVDVPSLAALLGPRRTALGPLVLAVGAVLLVAAVLAVQTALGLVFDPRYRDFPFAAFTAAAVPFGVLALLGPRRAAGKRGLAETLAACVLALAAVYIVLNEGFANWQAEWLAASLAGLALILARVRDAQS